MKTDIVFWGEIDIIEHYYVYKVVDMVAQKKEYVEVAVKYLIFCRI